MQERVISNVHESIKKENIVRETFENLKNGSPVDSVMFMNSFRRLPKEEMIKNISCLYEMNTNMSVSFLNLLIETTDFSDSELNAYKESVQNFISTSKEPNKKLNDTISVIESEIARRNSNEVLRDNTLMHLYEKRIKSKCLFESYLENELEIIMYNINYSPETIADLELLIQKIKTCKTTQYFSSFPRMLEKSTELIQVLNVQLSGQVLELVVSIPMVIADELIAKKASASMIKTYKKIYEKQIATMSKVLKGDGRPDFYNLYTTYMRVLIQSVEKLDRYVNNDYNNVLENVSSLQPDIVASSREAVIDDLTGDLQEMMVNLVFDENKDEFDEDLLENFTRVARTYEVLTEGKKLQNAADKVGDFNRKVSNGVVRGAKEVKQVKTTATKSVEPLTNLINNTVNEIKEADKKERTDRIITGEFRLKAKNVITKGILAIAGKKAGKAIAAKATTTAATAVSSKIAGGAAVKAATHGKIVGGAIKGAGAAKAGAASKGILAVGKIASPILIIIGLLTARAINKKMDEKYRKAILNDLELELKIVNEKLEDAKSDSDKEAKYELMRIQNKLEKDIQRIKYGLKE